MISEKQILQITNDINEQIDPRASRQDLRDTINYWAKACAAEATKRAALESRLAMLKAELAIINTILK